MNKTKLNLELDFFSVPPFAFLLFLQLAYTLCELNYANHFKVLNTSKDKKRTRIYENIIITSFLFFLSIIVVKRFSMFDTFEKLKF